MIINFFNINEEFTNILLTETYQRLTCMIGKPSVTDILDRRTIGDRYA